MSTSNQTPATLWYNPSCSKSRKALSLLQGRGIEPVLFHYLDTPPDTDAIRHVLGVLGCGPRGLMRKKEVPYTKLDLDNPELDDDALLSAMQAHPIIIERPVFVLGDKAIIARPPELALSLLD